jgi:hypothetical protein
MQLFGLLYHAAVSSAFYIMKLFWSGVCHSLYLLFRAAIVVVAELELTEDAIFVGASQLTMLSCTVLDRQH